MCWWLLILTFHSWHIMAHKLLIVFVISFAEPIDHLHLRVCLKVLSQPFLGALGYSLAQVWLSGKMIPMAFILGSKKSSIIQIYSYLFNWTSFFLVNFVCGHLPLRFPIDVLREVSGVPCPPLLSCFHFCRCKGLFFGDNHSCSTWVQLLNILEQILNEHLYLN